MSVSRRRFLKSGAVVSAALVLKPEMLVFGKNSSWSNNAFNHEARVRSYSRDMFEPYVGDIFRVRVGKQVVDLRLLSLTNLEPASGITTGRIARTDCFSMRFHAVRPLPTSETIHTLNHSKLGSFDLFMVQSEEKGRFWQTAIVNHVV